ncbi:MAG: FMN-binding protein, partial [bacterium]
WGVVLIMKTFLKNNVLLFGLFAFLTAIFVLGGIYSRYVAAAQTDRIEAASTSQQEQEWLAAYGWMLPGADSIEAFTSSSSDATYPLAGNRGDYAPSLVASYKLYQNDGLLGVVYIVDSYGKFVNLTIAYAIDVASDEIVAVHVVSHQETPGYFAFLDAAFYAQFDHKPLADAALAVDAVAGATYSSKGFEIGMLYARELYATDFGFVIPTLALTLNSVAYNLDPATFVDRPFYADVTYGPDDTNVVVYLHTDFTYAGLVSGVGEPDAAVQAAIQNAVQTSGQVSAAVGFVSYDAGTRTVVLSARGYNGQTPIRVTFVLNAAFDGFSEYTVQSSETYDDEDNFDYGDPPYIGAAVPAVEAAIIDDYQADGVVNIDTVAGASGYTVPAMKAMMALLDQFMSAMNGGE